MESGLFTVDPQARTVRGLLLPWNVRSRPSVSKTKPILFPPHSVRLPRDPMIVGLNKEHDRFSPIGRATVLEYRDAGVFAEFAIANTDEGDEWLADHGRLVKLSAEVRDIERDESDQGTAYLVGAAVVPEGAFEGAALFAADPDETHDLVPDTDPDPDPDEEQDPDETPVSPDEEPDEEPDEDEETPTMAEATAPATMLAQARTKRQEDVTPLDKRGFFAALIHQRQTGDMTRLSPYLETMIDESGRGLFSLTDIKYDGAGGLAADAKIPNTWLGELWQGRRVNRTVVPLMTQGTLSGLVMDGWVWTDKPTVALWAGNKTPVPSDTAAVAPKQFFAQRIAGAHDLSREYYDFNRTDVITSYLEAMVDSYAIVSDGYALTQLVAGATTFTPGTATENKGLMAVIDGALAVIAAQATPSYAIVSPSVFRDIMTTPHSSALEYFNAAVGLEQGSTSGFSILPDARLVPGQVVVGAREAATAWELPGSPIRVSALDLVKGGVDEMLVGYIALGVTYPAAVVKATTTITTTETASRK